MNRVSVRIAAVAVLMLAVAGGTHLAGGVAKAPQVHMPEVDFREMPLELGAWQGEAFELDPEIFNAIGAEVVADRHYDHPEGYRVSFHGAVFKDPEEGVYHTPTNCYRAAGWQRAWEREVSVEVSGARTIPVLLSLWERDSDRVFVLNWYELGKYYNIKGRWTMGWLRWEMRNQKVWPALSKVLLQTSIGEDEEAARTRILEFAGLVSRWMEDNMREHAAAPTEGPPVTERPSEKVERTSPLPPGGG